MLLALFGVIWNARTQFRRSVCPAKRVAITLEWLAHSTWSDLPKCAVLFDRPPLAESESEIPQTRWKQG